MPPKKLPYWPVYPGDMAKDLNLKMCSRAAKGAWLDVMNLMHESEERGVLVVCGKPLTVEETAAAIGGDYQEALTCIRELLDKGAFSRRKNGAIYSRRMVREEEQRQKSVKYGALGGNPRLKGGVNPPDIPPDNQMLKMKLKLKEEEESNTGGGSGEPFNPASVPSSPKGAYQHWAIVPIREKYPAVKWTAKKQGIEPPDEVATLMSAFDSLSEVLGKAEVTAVCLEFAAGRSYMSEIRTASLRRFDELKKAKAEKQVRTVPRNVVDDDWG